MIEVSDAKTDIREYYETLPKAYRYESTGLPFNSKTPEILDYLKEKRLKKRKPSLIIVDGASGEGKSTLTTHITEYLQGELIDYKTQYAMGGKDFLKKIKLCVINKKLVCVYDEAGDYNKRGFWTQLNRNLNRVFDIYRTFNIIVILVLPVFGKIDNNLFDARIPRLLFHCEKRNETFGRIKVYGLWRMLYLKSHLENKKLVIKPEAYNFTQPNYRGEFKNLPPKRETELDNISSRGKMKELQFLDILNRDLADYSEIAKKVGRSEDWVKRKISKLKIKEEEVYKRKKYFNTSIIPKLKRS
jgi:energy-coupling factor transporter ATP-binding protein EcfA2